MSNIEVKNLAHTNIMQFALELQSLIQTGWVFNVNNARTLTIHGGVLRASLVRSVNQATEVKASPTEVKASPTEVKVTPTEVKGKEAEVPSVDEAESIVQSPVGKTTIKRATKGDK